MFGQNKKRYMIPGRIPDRIDSLISKGTHVNGNIIFSGGLRIEGEVHGDVRLADGETGVLMLNAQGVVRGDIETSHLILEGEIEGGVLASQSIEMHSSARIVGDVSYRYIELKPGATIVGNMILLDENGARVIPSKSSGAFSDLAADKDTEASSNTDSMLGDGGADAVNSEATTPEAGRLV